MASAREQQELLEAAGFVEIVVTDVTREFLETARQWFTHAAELEDELRSTLGDALFDEQQTDRKEMIAAVEKGLLSRALFLGARPN